MFFYSCFTINLCIFFLVLQDITLLFVTWIGCNIIDGLTTAKAYLSLGEFWEEPKYQWSVSAEQI